MNIKDSKIRSDNLIDFEVIQNKLKINAKNNY
jgi:hypothetical protein